MGGGRGKVRSQITGGSGVGGCTGDWGVRESCGASGCSAGPVPRGDSAKSRGCRVEHPHPPCQPRALSLPYCQHRFSEILWVLMNLAPRGARAGAAAVLTPSFANDAALAHPRPLLPSLASAPHPNLTAKVGGARGYWGHAGSPPDPALPPAQRR